MDWERRNGDDLMRKRGTVSIFDDPKPIETIPRMADLMKSPSFPHSALGKKVRTTSFVGTISEILYDGARIKITSETKLSKTFVVELLWNVEQEVSRENKKRKNKNRQPS